MGTFSKIKGRVNAQALRLLGFMLLRSIGIPHNSEFRRLLQKLPYHVGDLRNSNFMVLDSL